MSNYQLDYASLKPQMYDRKSREKKAIRIIRTLGDYFGEKKLEDLKLLDIGSSTGIIDNFLSGKFKEVYGIDIDEGAVEFAKKNFKKNNLFFSLGDALNLKFPDKSFDVVICTHIYEHVPNPEKLISEIYRVLKPKGVCYFAAINKWWFLEPHYNLPFLSWLPKEIANFYIKLSGRAESYYETPRSYKELQNLTKKFKVIDYTEKILRDPRKFGYDNQIGINGIGVISKILKYYTPTFFWLLVKTD